MLSSSSILTLSGLLSFWNFQEPGGKNPVSQGAFVAPLLEGGLPVQRANEGVFGPCSLELEPGKWLRIPADRIGPLNLHGPHAQVTVIAWIKRRPQTPEWCDFIAGLWDERRHRRQYGLFLGLGLRGVEPHRQVCGHISASGGPSPGLTFCDEAASGASPIPYEEWTMVGLTYDAQKIRAYHQGKLDVCHERNPYAYPLGIHEGGSGGSDFTVGAVSLPSQTTDPRMDSATTMGCWFSGLIGGLAIFNRALPGTEMHRLSLGETAIIR